MKRLYCSLFALTLAVMIVGSWVNSIMHSVDQLLVFAKSEPIEVCDPERIAKAVFQEQMGIIEGVLDGQGYNHMSGYDVPERKPKL